MSTLLLKKTISLHHPRGNESWIYFFTFVSCVRVTHFTFASILDSLIRVSRRVGYPSGNKIGSIHTFCMSVPDLSNCGRFLHVQGISLTLKNPILCLGNPWKRHSWIDRNSCPFRPFPNTFLWDTVLLAWNIQTRIKCHWDLHSSEPVEWIIRSNNVISGLFSLFFQSTFNLSLAVLLCYQFSHCI